MGMTAMPRVTKTWRDKMRPATGARTERETKGGGTPGSEPPMLRSSLATNVLAAFFLVYVFCWNLTTVSEFSVPDRVYSLGYSLGLDQSWSMFAPYPSKAGGWYVIPGTLRDGQEVDLLPVTSDDLRLHEVSWEKPEHVGSIYKNQHWRKYLSNILKEEEYTDQRLYLGRYLCREWNAHHTGAQQLMTFQITYMLEETLPDYKSSAPQKVVLWEHRCV